MNFEKRIETIAAPGLDLGVFVVPWDSMTLGFGVAQIDRIAIKDDGDPALGMQKLRAWLDDNSIRLASCRIPSDRLHESMLLEANGFRFVEMVYGPVLSPLPADPGTEEDISIGEAAFADLPAIEEIASTAFSTSRFFLDWRVDAKASHCRYLAWVRNSFEDRRQKVLKASVADNLIGFFVVEERPDQSIYWHLTAISPAWQGRGLGKRLWRAMIARHRAAGVRSIATTISAHNSAVINIYARLGFKFGAPQMTFHWIRA